MIEIPTVLPVMTLALQIGIEPERLPVLCDEFLAEFEGQTIDGRSEREVVVWLLARRNA